MVDADLEVMEGINAAVARLVAASGIGVGGNGVARRLGAMDRTTWTDPLVIGVVNMMELIK
jgi:hypothetical protein